MHECRHTSPFRFVLSMKGTVRTLYHEGFVERHKEKITEIPQIFPLAVGRFGVSDNPKRLNSMSVNWRQGESTVYEGYMTDFSKVWVFVMQ